MRSLLMGFRRRVGGLDGVNPPLGGVGASVWSVAVAKVQTRWVKIAENGLFLLNGSAFWRIRYLSWCVVRT